MEPDTGTDEDSKLGVPASTAEQLPRSPSEVEEEPAATNLLRMGLPRHSIHALSTLAARRVRRRTVASGSDSEGTVGKSLVENTISATTDEGPGKENRPKKLRRRSLGDHAASSAEVAAGSPGQGGKIKQPRTIGGAVGRTRGRGRGRGRGCSIREDEGVKEDSPEDVARAGANREAAEESAGASEAVAAASNRCLRLRALPEGAEAAADQAGPARVRLRGTAVASPEVDEVSPRPPQEGGEVSGAVPQPRKPGARAKGKGKARHQPHSAEAQAATSPPPKGGVAGRAAGKRRSAQSPALMARPAEWDEAPLDKIIVPGSEDERWVRNHPLYIKITQRGYPLPFGEREILALKAYTPCEYGGDAVVGYM